MNATRLFVRIAAVALALACESAAAQAYPGQPVKWLVPYAAGGGLDNITRRVSVAMSESLGQPIVIENRPGASTNIAAETLARARPDGTTVMTADNASLIVNEHLFKSLRYAPGKDFAVVGPIGRLPIVLCASPALKVSSYQELMDWIAANPDKATYGSPGFGSPHHLSMELFKERTGAKIQLVPYQGIAPAFRDLTTGEIAMMWVDLAAGRGLMTSGKVVPLANGAMRRHEAIPSVPTFAELGLPGIATYAYIGLIAPAGTPADELGRLGRALREALAQPATARWLAEAGVEPMSESAEQFRAFTRAESARWGEVIRKIGLRLD